MLCCADRNSSTEGRAATSNNVRDDVNLTGMTLSTEHNLTARTLDAIH